MKRISRRKAIKASEFDRAFEEGDVTKYLDLKTAKVRYPLQRINIDFTVDILKKVDVEASRIGVPDFGADPCPIDAICDFEKARTSC